MNDILNSIINFDLHIHSKASSYKESSGIVDNSTKENLDTLLRKLNEYEVALFSITDHNRFDSELYEHVVTTLNSSGDLYPNVKSVLAGVEFDVVLEDNMPKCHIIVIFDAQNDTQKFRKISDIINANILVKPEETYPKDSFEKILKEIGLSVILIASQRKDLNNNSSGKHNSLSDATCNVEEIIKLGYIDALEFQKPQVEGILLHNLKTISLPMPLFSGSDCHDWSVYPCHDSKNKNKNFHHSRAKILPTFKGLLMAITSPEIRFNCIENTNKHFIDSISIRGTTIPLVNGINAIIGENGAGKTTLLKLLNNKISDKYVKDIIRDNEMSVGCRVQYQLVKYIEQGQIIKRFNADKLFTDGEESNFKELDHTPFLSAYCSFAKNLKNAIECSIKQRKTHDDLVKHTVTYKENLAIQNYHVEVQREPSFDATINPHDSPYKKIKFIQNSIEELLSDEYFKEYTTQVELALQQIYDVYNNIEKKRRSVNYEAHVKNIIHKCVDEYLIRVNENSSAQAREASEYKAKKLSTCNAVVEAIRMSSSPPLRPVEPGIIKGVTQNPKYGFNFQREAEYNGISMLESFFATMFVKDYNSLDKLLAIDTYETFTDAIKSCTVARDVSSKWNENLEKFINTATRTRDCIMEAGQQVGSTLGEMSLTFYRFFTHDTKDWNILIIDQPEDNISNNNISKKLLGYFNAIRDKKQVIFVTHNPLLVVNLDVDNVVFVSNNRGTLTTSNGCLEYESINANILKLIADNMDGGKETIEKRLKVYA